MIWHGLTTKVTPLILTAIGLLFVFQMTRPFVAWLDATNVLYSYIFFIAGVAFFYEMGLSLPETVRGTGSKFGAMLLAGLGSGSIIVGLAVFFGIYNILTDTSIINWGVAALMFLQIGVFLAQGWEEIVHYRRYKLNWQLL